MAAVTVALVGSKDLGRELGKKGTSSDVTLYNSVREGHATTVIEPTQFPEKFPPLLFALAMGDRIILHVPALTKEVAEAAATVDLFDAPVLQVLGEGVGVEELRKAFRGTRLETSPAVTLDLPKLRETVEGWRAEPRPGPVVVRIDHAFPVKGVGAVALGVVGRGVVHAHERLRLYPEEKEVEVRSIQVHDVEVREAGAGERVGLALKGVEAEELSRGQTLAPADSLTVASELAGTDWRVCRYYRGKPAAGQSLHVLVGLQFVPARLEAIDGGSVRLRPDRPVGFADGDPIHVADLSAVTGPRIVGRAVARRG
jgi:selenocysteine-specific translation elongation factor